MRLAFTIAASCLGLLLLALQPAASQSSAPLPASSAPEPVPAVNNPSDAAEKHAKRTACLKDAKTKKLVGAQKTAFLKDCMASDAAKPLASASSAISG